MLAVSALNHAYAADTRQKPSVEAYLKRLGYEPIALTRGESNHLYADGKLGDKKRTFMLDTGCSFTILNKSVGRKLKTLRELNVKLEDSYLGKVTDSSTVLMERLVLGRAEFVNQPARVRDLGFVPSDGLLGCDFLYRNYCLIDCMNRRLYVRSGKPATDVENAMKETFQRSGYFEVPLKLTRDLVATCEAKINGQPINLVVDTGAVWSTCDESLVAPLHLKLLDTWVNLVGVGRIGSHHVQLSTVKTLQLGELVLEKVDFAVAALGAWGIAESNQKNALREVGGFLGGHTLALNSALIDCRGQRLWLKPKRAFR